MIPSEERKEKARDERQQARPAPETAEEFADERELVADVSGHLKKGLSVEFIPDHALADRPVTTPTTKRARAMRMPPEAALDFSKYPEFGEDYVVLIARDPEFLFACWEMTFEAIDRYARATGGVARPTVVLRIREADAPDAGGAFYDLNVGSRTGNYYFPVPGRGKAFYAELGLVGPTGFWMVARSNTTVVPRAVGLPSGLEEKLKEYARRAYQDIGKSSW
jgi:hypothetical protein